MTNKEIEAIEARAKAATGGPWTSSVSCNADVLEYGEPPRKLLYALGSVADRVQFTGTRDADFIAHARQDIPALLQEIGRLKETVCPLGQQIKVSRDHVLYATKYKDEQAKSTQQAKEIERLREAMENAIESLDDDDCRTHNLDIAARHILSDAIKGESK